MNETITTIKPQPGPQEGFLSTPADIAFYGGAAGGGKTYALLIEPLRHIRTVAGFGAVIFRRTTPQIRNEGGLWDESHTIYRQLGAKSREAYLDWRFGPYRNSINFSHMERDADRYSWDGSQIPLIGFDQLEQFSRKQFFYLLSRNRSTCGIRPYVRCTYNPVPDDDPIGGWIHEFVSWYLDADGYPDPELSGVIRWFVNVSDTLHWYDSKEEALEAYPDIPPQSFTYIRSTVHDNKILLEKDPGYLARLHGLDNIDQERLLRANHKIRAAAGKVFNKAWFQVVDALPTTFDGLVRFWDLAATEKKQKGDPDYTAGVLMGVDRGVFYVLDVIAEQIGPAEINALMYNTATQDGPQIAVRWEEEGGASGKRDSWSLASMLAGWNAAGIRPQGDKLTRSKALAAQALAGNVKVLQAEWTQAFINHMHAIPDGGHDDIHDAAAGAFNELATPLFTALVIEHEPVEISPY